MSLTGTALELDAKFEVVKKLKLVGYPDKIFKKTAFIKGMFNSDLEASLFRVLLSRTRLVVKGNDFIQGTDFGLLRFTTSSRSIFTVRLFFARYVDTAGAFRS